MLACAFVLMVSYPLSSGAGQPVIDGLVLASAENSTGKKPAGKVIIKGKGGKVTNVEQRPDSKKKKKKKDD